MTRRSPFPPANQLPAGQAVEPDRCPKCHGSGSVVLMRRQVAPDIVDTCPGCLGSGMVNKKKVGYLSIAFRPRAYFIP